MALRGIRVVEIAGLAPAPFCGMILADFGASVIRVDRAGFPMSQDRLARGKKSIAINMKDHRGRDIVEQLAVKSDVLIEPFRPGVMEKLELGPDKLLSLNPRLVYARLSGYGQTGPYAKKAGHDINYVAISGILSKLGRKGQHPTPPVNLLADFAGGGLMCAFGILMSLFERQTSGRGQVVDTSMVEGTAYVSSFIFKGIDGIMWGKDRGENLLDTGAHFYDTYKTSDGKFMAVGSLEPQFYERLLKGLDVKIDQFSDFEESKKIIAKRFATKTRAQWTTIFDSDELDACVTPVLEMDEAPEHEQNKFRCSLVKNPYTKLWEPQAAPRLSRTPGQATFLDPEVGGNSYAILKEFGYSADQIQQLVADGVVDTSVSKSKL